MFNYKKITLQNIVHINNSSINAKENTQLANKSFWRWSSHFIVHCTDNLPKKGSLTMCELHDRANRRTDLNSPQRKPSDAVQNSLMFRKLLCAGLIRTHKIMTQDTKNNE